MQDDRERKSIAAGAPGAAGDIDDETLEARDGEDESVLTLVCLKCGREYYFSDSEPESGMSCDKCGSTVFRDFYSAGNDEAAQDFRDSTERDLDSDDPEGDTRPGDVIDLNRG